MITDLTARKMEICTKVVESNRVTVEMKLRIKQITQIGRRCASKPLIKPDYTFKGKQLTFKDW